MAVKIYAERGESAIIWRTFSKSFVLVLFFVCHSIWAFNVEWRHPTKYRGPNQSMFGFSIAQHKEGGRSWVIIGAPEAPDITGVYPPDYHGGAVFYCDSDRDDSCHQISFRNSSYQPSTIDNRTGQWLGATVRSSGENGIILACAPRYFWFKYNYNDKEVRDPVGTCFTTKNMFQEPNEYSPCRTKGGGGGGHAKRGSCEVGLGAAISKDSSRMYLGAVGSYYWQGEVISVYTSLRLPFIFDENQYLYNPETGQIITMSTFTQPTLRTTKEGSSKEDDSYMGYSMESMTFLPNITGVAVGVPRGSDLYGKVQLYTWNLTNLLNITGEQFGSYFGYSIAVADVNGDGSEDVIIGAPMYSDYGTNKNEYEKGRVYVYYQDRKPCSTTDTKCWVQKFKSVSILEGEYTKSRFGLSLAALGDINKDGFEDFAVGAPYMGSSDDCMKSTVTGAVYIYHGSRNGVRSKYSQRITADELHSVSQNSLTTFGFSLSGGLDLDNNLYPDLAVGAYESDMVYLFRSRPVINLNATLRFLSESKLIDLERFVPCRHKNGESVPCVNLELCLGYNGIGVDESIDLQVEISLDINKTVASRMLFLHSDLKDHEERFRLLKGAGIVCRIMEAYITPLRATDDKLTPLIAELRYSLIESLHRYGELKPVLNMDDDTPLTRRDFVGIKNNCGPDNICIPELHMRVQPSVNQFSLGSGTLVFNVTVENRGEDSFGTVFKLQVPPSVLYNRFDFLNHTYLTCNPPSKMNNNTVVCNIGNPLQSRKSVSFNITLQPKMEIQGSELYFSFVVNSTNPQISALTDTVQDISIPIIENTTLSIDVGFNQKEIHYNSSQYNFKKIENDEQAGPFLRHTYTIKNLGPSEVSEANVIFIWPSKTLSNEDLLYLIQGPSFSHTGIGTNVQCTSYSKDNFNYRKLKLTRRMKDGADQSQSDMKGTSSQQTSHSTWTQVSHTGTHSSGSSINEVNKGNINKYDYGKGYEHEKNTGNTIQTGGSVVQTEQDSFYHKHQGGYGNQNNYQGGYTVSSGGSQQSQSGGTSQGGYVSSNVHSGGGSYQENKFHTGGSSQQGFSVSGSQQSGGSYYGQTQIGGSTAGSGSYEGGTFTGYPPGFAPIGTGSHPIVIQSGNTGNVIGAKNVSTFHESESSITKQTKWNENGPVTFINSSWIKNDNGNVRSGGSSTVIPGHSGVGHFFENENSNSGKFFTNQGGSHGYGIHDGGGGTVIKKEYGSDGSVLTTFDEGVRVGKPHVSQKEQETEHIYHVKSENTHLLQPTRLPDGSLLYNPPKSWQESRNPHADKIDQFKKEGKIDLHSSQNDDAYVDDDVDEHNNESEDGEENRKKRNAESVKSATDDEIFDHHFCTPSTCTRVECTINRLAAEQEVTVTFRSVVWMETIKKIAINRPVQVGSYAEVNIKKLPHVREPKLNTRYTAEILTNITSLDFGKTPPDVVPLWIVVTSACLGALILMLLVYLLYKSGFFKRNRPPTLPERQPLKSNGNYHFGDEAL